MFENSKWIGMENCEIASWRGTDISDEEIEALPSKIKPERGSLVFRKEFTLDQQVKNACIAICGLGYYDVWINGRRPDEKRVLSPVYSSYFKMTRYDVYDITHLLCKGENVIAVEICGGWFSPPDKWWGWRQMWHGNPRMIAQISASLADGTELTISSDENWKTAHGSVVENCIYDGETVDFSRIDKNWNMIGYDASEWNCAIEAESPTDNLCESTCPPVRIINELLPTNVNRLSETQAVYDFGVNGSALPRITVKGKAGDRVQLEFAEFINEDGTLDKTSENRALNTDVYILSGGVDVCMPRFTWHGYRYMMITVSSPDVEIIKAEKCVIHSDIMTTGAFTCSNGKLNLLHEAYVRSELACLIGVPLDCNQRDERLPWLGDACVTSDLCLYNFDMRALYSSFLEDMKLGRSPSRKTIEFISPRHTYDDGTSIDWNLAYPVILIEYYERYGDLSVLKSHFETLIDHTEYYVSTCENGFIPPCWFGDWFSIDMPEGMEKVAFAAGPDGHRQNPTFAATMFYCQLLRITAEIAELVGENEKAARYYTLRDESAKALCEKYYNYDSGIFASGGQFLLTYVLAEHIVPDDQREKVFDNLIAALEETDWHMLMGVIGTRRIFDVLSEFGRYDIAFKLLTVEGYPSPLNMIAKGETTLTEGLNGDGSGCHCMFASPDTAFYRILGGITVNRRCDPVIKISPYCPEGLDFVSSSQIIEEGKVISNWRRVGDKIVFEIEIPCGCTASVSLTNVENKKEAVLGEGRYSFVL